MGANELRELARRFSDSEYLTKSEIKDIVGEDKLDEVWQETFRYREGYRTPIILKKWDNVPFSLCLADSIKAYFSYLNELIKKYKDKYDLLECCNDSDFVREQKAFISEDFYNVSKILNLNITQDDIMMIMESKLGVDNKISSILASIKYVLKYNDNVDKNFILSIESLLESKKEVQYKIDNNISFNKLDASLNDVIRVYYDNSKSYILNSAIILFIFAYYKPFAENSLICGILVAFKYLKDRGYGNCFFYSKFFTYYINNIDSIENAINNTGSYSDFTYFLIAYMQVLIEGLEDCYSKIENIIPSESTRKKEVIKIDLDKTIKEIQGEETKLDYRKKYFNKVYKKPENTRKKYDFEEDPFVKPVDDSDIDIYAKIKDIKDGPVILLVEKLRELELLQEPEIYFYANNHDVEKNYTVYNYKEFAHVSLENARKSFNSLVKHNLYVKIDLGDKVIYKANNGR